MTKLKTLCDLDKKDIDKKLGEITKIVMDPNYICRKCSRVSNKKNTYVSCKELKLELILTRLP